MSDSHTSRKLTLPGLVSIVAVALLALVLLALLYRTQSNAAAIRTETAQIAQSARGINDYTDSIMQLDRTNTLTNQILGSVRPIHGSLGQVIGRANDIGLLTRSIQDSTGSINGSAASIDGSTVAIRDGLGAVTASASTINGSLGGINENAGKILAVTGKIADGVRMISGNLDVTAKVVNEIRVDAQGIDGATRETEHYAACIDNGLNGGVDCERRPQG